MTEPTDTPTRAEQRRQQILNAAAECFRRYGFHGASIAKISKAAGMSAGHIYHFFENKEAIIAAIVEQRVEQSIELVTSFESETDVFGAMVERVDLGFEDCTDPAYTGLWLEVLAESARNPQIAEIVQNADRKMRQRITRLEGMARSSRGLETRLDPEAVTEIIMALFGGLANRAVQNPDLNKVEVLKVLRIAAKAILEA